MPNLTRNSPVHEAGSYTKIPDLLDLRHELEIYRDELESRIQHDKPYNLFGTFLHTALGFSEATLQRRGIFTAAAKKPLAERLLSAVNYALDKHINELTDTPLEPVGDLSRAILNGGRLGKLKARLDVCIGTDSYDAMLRREEHEPRATSNPSIIDRFIALRSPITTPERRQDDRAATVYTTHPRRHRMFDAQVPLENNARDSRHGPAAASKGESGIELSLLRN